jgi:hypothetical protein
MALDNWDDDTVKAHVQLLRKTWGPEFPKLSPAQQVEIRVKGMDTLIKYYEGLEQSPVRDWTIGIVKGNRDAAKAFVNSPDFKADSVTADKALMAAIYEGGDKFVRESEFLPSKEEIKNFNDKHAHRAELEQYETFSRTFPAETARKVAEATEAAHSAETLGAKAEQAAEAGVATERNWSKLFRNAEGKVHGGKVAAWTAGIAAVGAGIYALSHSKKEEERSIESSSSAKIRN